MDLRDWRFPDIPARRPGWEHGFVDVLQGHIWQPFAWGAHDCLRMPADLCLAMTDVDPMKGLKRYASETGARRILAALGFRTVEDALQAVFPEIPLLRARRGDCGVVEQEIDGRPWLSTHIVVGDRAVALGPKGPSFVPLDRLKRTFAIGAV